MATSFNLSTSVLGFLINLVNSTINYYLSYLTAENPLFLSGLSELYIYTKVLWHSEVHESYEAVIKSYPGCSLTHFSTHFIPSRFLIP